MGYARDERGAVTARGWPLDENVAFNGERITNLRRIEEHQTPHLIVGDNAALLKVAQRAKRGAPFFLKIEFKESRPADQTRIYFCSHTQLGRV